MSDDLVPSNPWEMILKEQANGTPIRDMAAAFDLYERWLKIEAEKSWNRAMQACQLKIQPLVKNKENTHKKIWYTTFDQLDLQIRPIYLEEGLSLGFTEILPSPNPEICCMALDVMHVDGFSRRSIKNVHIDGFGTGGNRSMTATQGDGSTISYARRYLCEMAFNLAREGDDVDGDAETQAIISEAEVKLLKAAISETTVLCGMAVDINALLKFASPNAKSLESLNREQYLRCMNDLGFRRQKAQQKGK